MEEFEFILDFVKETDFGYTVCCRQLRSLWTAYCLHNNLNCDTGRYDNNIHHIYNIMSKNNSCTWNDFDSFDMYMCHELV